MRVIGNSAERNKSMETAVIVGAGKGMGNHIAERFAREGFRVVLIARRENLVKEYVSDFHAKGYDVSGMAADASNFSQMHSAFQEIHRKYGSVEVLVYNAAFVRGGEVTSVSATECLQHFAVDVAGAVCCVNEVLPFMRKRQKGAILFSGGQFGIFPNANPDFACISMDKAALRQYVQMLNEALKGSGIYAGIVNIMGIVDSNEYFSPERIADAYWELYTGQKDFECMYG